MPSSLLLALLLKTASLFQAFISSPPHILFLSLIIFFPLFLSFLFSYFHPQIFEISILIWRAISRIHIFSLSPQWCPPFCLSRSDVVAGLLTIVWAELNKASTG